MSVIKNAVNIFCNMLFLSLSRVIRFSAQNFARNIWLSIVTITIVVLTLFSVTTLVFVNAVMEQAIQLVESKVDVSVYFKPTVTAEQIFAVQTNLEALDYVRDVEYVSKSQALEKLRVRYNNSPLILESLKELNDNPLNDTLIVRTHDTSDYQKVIDILNATPQYAVLIENKNFDDNQAVVRRLERIAAEVTGVGWAVTIFFSIIAILVIVNTIRIAIYTHRSEISIMKLVGASNWFVRGPFIGEAIFYALVGTLITLGISYLVTNVSDPFVVNLLGQTDFSLLRYMNQNVVHIFGIEFIGMVFVSVFSTSIALTRYLRV